MDVTVKDRAFSKTSCEQFQEKLLLCHADFPKNPIAHKRQSHFTSSLSTWNLVAELLSPFQLTTSYKLLASTRKAPV